jgi:hypothetical protein
VSVVSNACPLINLAWVGKLDLLHTLYGELAAPYRNLTLEQVYATILYSFFYPFLLRAPSGKLAVLLSIKPEQSHADSRDTGEYSCSIPARAFLPFSRFQLRALSRKSDLKSPCPRSKERLYNWV